MITPALGARPVLAIARGKELLWHWQPELPFHAAAGHWTGRLAPELTPAALVRGRAGHWSGGFRPPG